MPYLQQMEEGRARGFCGVTHKINVALWAAESTGFIFCTLHGFTEMTASAKSTDCVPKGFLQGTEGDMEEVWLGWGGVGWGLHYERDWLAFLTVKQDLLTALCFPYVEALLNSRLNSNLGFLEVM